MAARFGFNHKGRQRGPKPGCQPSNNKPLASGLPTNRELSGRFRGYTVMKQVFWVRDAPARVAFR